MSHSLPDAAAGDLKLRLPALLLHLWTDERSAPLLDELDTGGLEGFHRLEPYLYALRPVAGDSVEVDLALACARRLLAPILGRRDGDGVANIAALMLPGEIIGSGQRWQSADDALLVDLRERPPAVDWNQIYLTGYVASRLEATQSSSVVSNYRRPSGGTVTIFRLPTGAQSREPWRNPRLLGGTTRFVPRPAMQRMMDSVSTQPVLRVSGPLGCGKSRLVWETLGPDAEPNAPTPIGGVLWTTLATPRTLAPPLVIELLQQLISLAARAPQPFDLGASLPDSEVGALLHRLTAGERMPGDVDLEPVLLSALRVCARKLGAPLRLIFDDVPTGRPEDVRLVLELIADLHGSEDVRFVLIGRSGNPWPAALSAAPEIVVPPLGESPMNEVANALFDGLSMPEPIQRRFVEHAQGCVFALEEGLVRMIHLRHLRRIYGNFFFGGNKDLEYEPSPRFVQHAHAEATQLGEAFGLRLLATVDSSIPPSTVVDAAAAIGRQLSEEWYEPYRAAGWLRYEPGPWGRGVTFTVPAIAQSVRSTLEAATADALRHQLGCVLADVAQAPEARWTAYSMIAGTPEALPLILALSRDDSSEISEKGVLEGLARELAALRRRGDGDEAVELQLLWRALPLARRLGRLERFEEELPRAIELAGDDPRKGLAFASLKTELDLLHGNLKAGEETLRRALELVVAEEPGRQALVLLQLGRLLMRQDRHQEARTLFEQLLPVMEESGSPAQVASCLFYLGNIALNQDRLERAEQLHQRALELRRREQRLKGIGSSHSSLGAVALAQGDYATALDHFTQAEQILEQHGDIGEVSYALIGRGRVLNRLGEYPAASKPLARALELRQSQSNAVGESIVRLWVATNQLDMGRINDALQAAREAHFALSMGSGSVQRGDAEQLLGRIQLRRKSFHKARQHFNAALAQYRLHNHISSVLVTESLLLERALEEGDESEIRRICRLLEDEGEHLRPLARRELVSFRLFRGHSWLEQLGNPNDSTDPRQHLQQAYWELMRKAAHLPPEMRNRFLFQVEENARIVDTATRHQLSLPQNLELREESGEETSGAG